MNLLTKTTLVYVLLIFGVFTIGGVISFQFFRKEVNIETDYHLYGQLNFIKEVIEKGAPVHALNYSKLQIRPVDSTANMNVKPIFSDTLVYHNHLKKLAPHRKLQMTTKIQNTWYNISLFESVLEEDDIMDSVTSSLSYTFTILVSLLILASVLLSLWIFRPFKKTLKAIEDFRINSEAIPVLEKTHVKEFTQLNQFLSEMMEKNRRDYHNLKEFIENSAHEIQTPLAIARGKLELLMEHEDLDAFQAQHIQVAYASLTRLSKLNNSLGLLSKIDNQEFSNEKPINFSKTLESKVEEFEELISLKELELETQIPRETWIQIDPLLLDILLTNLLQNSVKHNFVRGRIIIRLEEGSLVFSNTGEKPDVDPKQYFERFRKGRTLSNSHGLGLAIVKKVCEVSGMGISYVYKEGLHTIQLAFTPVSKLELKPAVVLS